MRLTLRTLLAYLDDTLEPAQAKLIGQKVAESDTAQELVERIKQVTRTRRLTAPPSTGPGGKIDPNTIAEYLDNAVTPEQSAEVEQICLASDVHLAEVAACHQILTLVLGEPPLVPPTAKQRMYGLVKGPEAIPFRKPPQADRGREGEYEESKETDETLRLGIPPFRRDARWHQRALIWGGSILAAALLVFALWQILSGIGGTDDRGHVVAQNGGGAENKGNGGDTDKKKKPEPDPKDQKKPPIQGENGDKKKPENGSTKEKDPVQPPEKKIDPLPDVPAGPPSSDVGPAGQYKILEGTPSVLVQQQEETGWRRVDFKKPQVVTGRTLVSLPGYRSVVELSRGVRLMLWGNLPELWPMPPLMESMVTLHAHKELDQDLTLHRGRIVLTNMRDKPLRVRLRFNNPTQLDQLEYADLTLESKGSEVLVDRWSAFAGYEPFFKDPKNVDRVGPAAAMGFIVMAGKVVVKLNDETLPMTEPPGPAMLFWESRKGAPHRGALPKIPEWISPSPPLPPGIDGKRRNAMLRARDELNGTLSTKDVEVGLTEAITSLDEGLRIFGVRCRGALNDYAGLVDLLISKNREVRISAMETLEYWLAQGRDHDYLLFPELKNRFPREAEKMMELLHGLNQRELLMDYLQNPSAIIREMAALRLAQQDALKKAGMK